MRCFIASAAIAFTCLTVVTSQLSCDSQLRLLPFFSHLFTHCECSYGNWTEWSVVNSTEIPLSQCDSGIALTENRWERVVSGDCEDRMEERYICR